jgi:hypothetical protein
MDTSPHRLLITKIKMAKPLAQKLSTTSYNYGNDFAPFAPWRLSKIKKYLSPRRQDAKRKICK